MILSAGSAVIVAAGTGMFELPRPILRISPLLLLDLSIDAFRERIYAGRGRQAWTYPDGA